MHGLKKITKFYDAMNFKYGFVELRTMYDAKGEMKKRPIYIKGNDWKNTESYLCNDKTNCCYIYLKPSNILVIDIDDMENHVCKKVHRIMKHITKYCIKTRKGYHYYFKYDSDLALKHLKNMGIPIDIMSGEAQIYAPPTKYSDPDGKEEFEYKPIIMESIEPIPDELKQYILDIIKEKEVIEEPEEIKERVKEDKKVREDKTYTKTSFQYEYINNDNVEKITELINQILDAKTADDYDIWIRVGMALRSEYKDNEIGFTLFKLFSNKSNKSDNDDILRKKYNSFNERNEGEKKITIGYLYYLCKKLDSVKYYDIMNIEYDITHVGIVNYINKIVPGDFLYVNGVHYAFNGKYYINDNEGLIFEKYVIFTVRNNLKASILSDIENLYKININVTDKAIFEKNIKLITKYNKYLKMLLKLEDNKFLKETFKCSASILCNNDILFDSNKYFVPFNNVIYDLQTETFIPHKKEYYIKKTMGYDWVEPTENKINILKKMISKIQPNDAIKDKLLRCYSYALDGSYSKGKFFIYTGRGSNGKTVLDELILSMMGNFGYRGNNSILIEKRKSGGANTDYANLNEKRLVVYSETEQCNKLQNNIIKEITGTSQISARAIYSNDDKTNLCGIYVLECNILPTFASALTDAEVRRIEVIEFNSKFTFDKSEINEANFIYEADSYYSSCEFKEDYKCAMFKLLLPFYKSRKNISDNKEVNNMTSDYLALSDPFVNMLSELITKTKNMKDQVSVRIIYDILPKKYKEDNTYRQFCEYIKKNRNYNNDYIAGSKKTVCCLQGYILNEIKDECII